MKFFLFQLRKGAPPMDQLLLPNQLTIDAFLFL